MLGQTPRNPNVKKYVFAEITNTDKNTEIQDVHVVPADPGEPVISDWIKELVLKQADNETERMLLLDTIDKVNKGSKP